MAQDRNGNPIAKDNLFRVPVRPVLPLQVEPVEGLTQLLHVYPETSEVSYLTGRVLEVSDGTALVSVDGSAEQYSVDTRLLEKTA